MNPKVPELKVPTEAQLKRRIDEILDAEDQEELDKRRRQVEAVAMAQLSAELNQGRVDALAAQAAAARGMSFVRDVWPDHPAASAVVAERVVAEGVAGETGVRPIGARAPFRLEPDGVWFVDYWVSSPLFPAGRANDGAVVIALKSGDTWRETLLNPPPSAGHGTYRQYGFETLRSFGLKINPENLRGAPELDIGATLLDVGDRAMNEGRVRTADELLWRFVNATQNEVLAAVSA